MVEIVDNAVQLAVMVCCFVFSGMVAVRKKSQSYVLVACFYGSYALGLLYWLLYLALKTYTPKIFYVSDLTWIASFLFLLALDLSLVPPEEKRFRCPAAWLAPAVCAVTTVFYCTYGDFVTNILWGVLTGGIGYVSVRGLLYARTQAGSARSRQWFHLALLFIMLMEHCLWTSSCFWAGDTLKNPYFWFDCALTCGCAALLPATKKAVGL